MTLWHGYIGIENLSLTGANRQTLIDGIKALGLRNDSPQPAQRNHWRVRLDNEAVIFEAAFESDNLSVAKFKQRLANLFDVDASLIDHSTTQQTFDTRQSPVVTFSRLGTDYLRVVLFGGIDATWQQSGDEVRAFLAANSAAWEDTV